MTVFPGGAAVQRDHRARGRARPAHGQLARHVNGHVGQPARARRAAAHRPPRPPRPRPLAGAAPARTRSPTSAATCSADGRAGDRARLLLRALDRRHGRHVAGRERARADRAARAHLHLGAPPAGRGLGASARRRCARRARSRSSPTRSSARWLTPAYAERAPGARAPSCARCSSPPIPRATPPLRGDRAHGPARPARAHRGADARDLRRRRRGDAARAPGADRRLDPGRAARDRRARRPPRRRRAARARQRADRDHLA